jgi:type VI secretion system secreted protein Hcp
MTIDAFLKITGVEGESRKKDFEKQIEFQSFSWSVSQTTTTHGGSSGGTAGKAHVNDITFMKTLDKTSPTLLQNCMKGVHHKEIIMTFRKTTGDVQMPFLIYTMNDCVLSSYSISASDGSPEMYESMSINFARIKMEYVEQDKSGVKAGANTATWDLTTGTPIP